MFDKFKNLARLLSFVFIFNFLVLNFGIKPKEVKATTIDITSARVINYDLTKASSNHLVFDFSRYLTEGEKIEDFVLKKGNTKINTQPVDNNKKAWKSRFILINGDKCSIEATALIGGRQQKLFYEFVYNNYELNTKPVLNFKGNDLEIVFSPNWLNLFAAEGEEVEIRLYTTGRTILDERVKINDIRNNSNKKTWSNKKSEFSSGDSGYFLDFTIGGRLYRNKVFNYGSDKTLGIMALELKSAEFKDDGKVQVEVLIKDNDIRLRQGDVLRRISGNKYQLDINRKIGTCLDSIGINSDVSMRLDQTDGKKYEGIFDFCLIRMIEKLNFSTSILNLENNSINIDLTGMHNFLSKREPSKNKLYIYELNNFSKGTKFGEKLSGVVSGVNSINIGNKSFDKTKAYLVEVTNGTYTISTPFVYTPMDITSSEIKETSVKIGWTYPSGYTPVSGDKIEIFLRDKNNSNNYSSIPNVALTHGSGNINLNNTTSTVVTGISPGTNYEVKVIFNNQRGSIVSFLDFRSVAFALKKPIEIKDAFTGNDAFRVAFPRTRTVTVEWDFEPNNIQFSSGDKVEIWVKPNTTSEFSGYPTTGKYNNPVFTKTQNLNSTKSANITLPSWMTNFHVDLIYTIGGKKIITNKKAGEEGEVAYNRRTVKATVNKPKLEIDRDSITQTSAKIKWEYDKDGPTGAQGYRPQNTHAVEINMKKVNSLNDYTTGGFDINNRKAWLQHGLEGVSLETKKEFEFTGLEVGQCYRVRLRHIVQQPDSPEEDVWHFAEEFINFQTVDFSIVNLKAEQQTTDSRQIKLMWGTNGTPDFGEGGEDGNIKVYLKEGNTSDYPQNPETVTVQGYSGVGAEQNLTKQCTINVPKYNTPYTAKVEYNLKGKKIEEHVLIEAKGDISLAISNINTTGAKITCNLPSGYSKKELDKVKLTVAERENNLRTLPNDKEITISNGKAEENLNSGIEENKDYDITVRFENKNSVVATATGSFKATSDFQIVDLNVSDIKATTAKLTWDFTPELKLDSAQEGESIEIYLKNNGTKKSSDPDDALTEFTKIYTMKQPSTFRSYDDHDRKVSVRSADQIHSQHHEEEGNIKDFKKLDLEKLKVGANYSVKVKYVAETTLSGDTNAKKEAVFDFKTISDEFKATVFTSNQTTATYGWEYPPGYEIQNGDKVEIFVKELKDDDTDADPQPDGLGYDKALLTLVHGSEEGEYDLNNVTKVDVSGLTPEKKYKSKIVFTMSGGHKTETEVNISTKSFSIKSFEVDSYEEYDILVKWEIEPENMMFNEADKLEIFVKLADGEYSKDPSYVLTTTPTQDGRTISNTFSDYVLAESIGVEQNMKLVYTVGDKTYEKELTFTNNIDPIEAKVFSVNETRALIEVETPSNYEFVNGDALLIYAKDEFSDGDVENDDFLVFEGVQSDTLSIADDMKLIELSYLLPEAKYDVVVALDLLDGDVDPVKLEFTTEALPITDIKLESINFDGSTISWDYGENEIDFYKDEQNDNFTDKLLIGVKESDGTPIPDDFNAIKQIAVEEHSGQDIAGVKDAKIKVEDKTKDYDVAVCCDIGGLSYIKKTKLSFLSVSVDESSILSNGAKVTWKYPSNITFGDSDKTEVFVRKKDDSNYPESPAFSSTGSGTTSYTLEGLEGSTEYIVKVQITKEGLQIDPVEAEFTTKGAASSEVVIDQPEYEITGTAAEIGIPNAEELDIDLEKPIGLIMGDEPFTGFSIKFNENGTSFTIEPTIPKKKYENIEVEIPLKDGTTFKMVIKEFTTQPADTAQDWLSNAYWFAFERFPDEEGYNYWYAHRIIPKTLNGEYFLKNLLFAEDEFTNRNLQDKELIAALYQIVVNREYDEEGLNFWVGIYGENLQNAQGDKKLAQEVLVDRMAHEPEFGKLCEKVGIFWRQIDQDAAGVPS